MTTYAERVTALMDFLRARNVTPITDYSPHVTPTALSTGLAGKADTAEVVRTVNGTAPDGAGNVSVAGAASPYELRGTGFPEGVVTADPGYYYTDTAGTNGAWRWLKTSGTAATGWRVVLGDTGLRGILSETTADPAPAGLLVQRVGSAVTISGEWSSPPTSAVNIWAIPTGFKPKTFYNVGQQGGTGKLQFTGSMTSPYITGLEGGGTWARFQITYHAQDPWPATLPGTAV